MTHLNVEGQRDGAYTVTEQQAVEQERDTTNGGQRSSMKVDLPC